MTEEVVEGVVVSQQANFFYVRTADGEVACHMRGRLKKEGETPLVGDRVRVVLEPLVEGDPLPPPRSGSLALAEGFVRGVRKGFIDAILPRKHVLERPAIANVDQLLIVMAADSPPFSPHLLDKFLVVASKSGLEPVIVINKRDLVPPERLAEIVEAYRRLGYRVYATQASPEGVAELVPALAGKVTVLAGPSGVGKSSLVNAVQPGLALHTSEVSTKLGRGRHTTRHAELHAVEAAPDALLADTPGFSYLSLEGVLPAELGWIFPEMAPLVPACKFPSCLHVHEPQCAVKDAPSISPERYESYLRLLEECEAYEKDAAERSSKVESGVKRRSGRAGQEGRLVKVDAAAREGDRRTRNQALHARWHEEAEPLDEGEDADDEAGDEEPAEGI
jgi:ribosome biogenesis GTPase